MNSAGCGKLGAGCACVASSWPPPSWPGRRSPPRRQRWRRSSSRLPPTQKACGSPPTIARPRLRPESSTGPIGPAARRPEGERSEHPHQPGPGVRRQGAHRRRDPSPVPWPRRHEHTDDIDRAPTVRARLLRARRHQPVLQQLHLPPHPAGHRGPVRSALTLVTPETPQALVARVYASLGDGYWRAEQPDKARETWTNGLARFPNAPELVRRANGDDKAAERIVHDAVDPDTRVDTTLRETSCHDHPGATSAVHRPVAVALWVLVVIGVVADVRLMLWYWPGSIFDGLTSSVWTGLAWDFAHGEFYRPLLGPWGYGGTRYMPLFFVAHGLLIRAHIDPVYAGCDADADNRPGRIARVICRPAKRRRALAACRAARRNRLEHGHLPDVLHRRQSRLFGGGVTPCRRSRWLEAARAGRWGSSARRQPAPWAVSRR